MKRIRAEVLLLTSLTPYRWAKAAHVVAVGLCGFVLLLCACDRENKETVARPAMRLQYSAISFWSTVVLFIYFLPFFSFFSLFFLFFLFFFLFSSFFLFFSFYLSVVDCLISFYLYLIFLCCCWCCCCIILLSLNIVRFHRSLTIYDIICKDGHPDFHTAPEVKLDFLLNIHTYSFIFHLEILNLALVFFLLCCCETVHYVCTLFGVDP